MALLKNFWPAVFKNIIVMRYLKKGVNLSLSLTCCRAPAVAQMSPKESKWHSPAACEPKSHLEKPNPGGKHRPVAGHRDAGGVTLWPSSRGSRFSLPSSSGLPKSPRFPQPLVLRAARPNFVRGAGRPWTVSDTPNGEMLEWGGGETKGFCTEGTKNILCVSLGSAITDSPNWTAFLFCF